MGGNTSMVLTKGEKIEQCISRDEQSSRETIGFFFLHPVVLTQEHLTRRRDEHFRSLVAKYDVRNFVCEAIVLSLGQVLVVDDY